MAGLLYVKDQSAVENAPIVTTILDRFWRFVKDIYKKRGGQGNPNGFLVRPLLILCGQPDFLSKQRENVLALRVRLGEHRGAGLLED